MNSKENIKSLLNRIHESLSESQIFEEIDHKIAFAISKSIISPEISYSHHQFHESIAKFIQFLYKHGLRIPRILSLSEALSEGIFLLENYYYNHYAKGYDAAVLDASNTDINGIQLIIETLAEIIKSIEKGKYIKWIFAHHIDSTDWITKSKITSYLLAQFKPLLPSRFQSYDPIQFVDCYKEIILNNLNTDTIINQLTSENTNIFLS